MAESLLLGPQPGGSGYETMNVAGRLSALGTTAADWILARASADFGDAQVDTTTLDVQLLDGENVTGSRWSNRTVIFELLVLANAGNEAALRAGVTAVKQIVEQASSFTLTSTPDPALMGGVSLPVIVDCYRGSAQVHWDLRARQAGLVRMTITAAAKPWLRSPSREVVSVSATGPSLLSSLDTAMTLIASTTSGAISGSAPTVTLDAGGAGPTPFTEGSAANRMHVIYPTVSGGPGGALNAPASFTEFGDVVFGSPVNLSAYTALTFDLAISAFNSIPADPTISVTLIDNSGVAFPLGGSLYGLAAGYFNGSNSTLTTAWHTLTIAFPGTVPTGFDITQVKKVRITGSAPFTAFTTYGPGASTSQMWLHLDRLVALAPSGAQVTTPYGAVYAVPNVKGAARTPVALAVTMPVNAHGLVLYKRPPEARTDYTPLVQYMSDGVTALGGSKAAPGWTGGPAAGAGARYNGTHAVWLAGVVLGGSGLRTVTVTFTFSGGFHSDTVQFRRVCQPSDVAGGLLQIDVPKAMPARAIPDDNTALGVTVTVTDSLSGATTVQDVLALDTRGPSLVIQQAYGGPFGSFLWVDEPGPTSSMGLVLVDGSTRAAAVAAFDAVLPSGGPMSLDPVDPGNNQFLAWCDTGRPPALTFNYSPRWSADRLQA